MVKNVYTGVYKGYTMMIYTHKDHLHVLCYACILMARPGDGYDMFSPRYVRGVEECPPPTGYDELGGGRVDLGFLHPRHRRGAREAWFPRVVAVPQFPRRRFLYR